MYQLIWLDILVTDHNVMYGHIAIPRNAVVRRTVTSQKLRGIDCGAFMKDIKLENFSLDNINYAVQSFDAELTRVLDKH